MTPASPPQLADAWANVQAELRRAVADQTYELWLRPLKPCALLGDTLVVTAPDQIRTWVTDRFGGVLQSCAAAVLGPEVTVDVIAAADARRVAAEGLPVGTPDAPSPAGTDAFNPKLTFDQFVIGDTNRFAHAAALAVAELPGQAYNPLFLYGPPGVGKTHLLQAIGNYVRVFGNGMSVRYTTVERFTNEFVGALQTGGMETFKERYRHNDVLLIDDVQFLERKVKTEEEFFHTFNALYDTGSQLVLTSDRLPKDMAALEDRLRERFESGLVADVAPPDLPTRMAILRKRVHHDGIALDDPAVLGAIARRIDVNVRTLEGALIRVVAFHSLTGRPIDVALADEVLSGLYPEARHGSAVPVRPSIDAIQHATCDAFAITREELLSASRTARLAWPRQVAMYLAREHTDETLPAIGRRFGGRNHTTVMHACGRAKARIGADRDAFEAVRELSRRIRGDGPPDAVGSG